MRSKEPRTSPNQTALLLVMVVLFTLGCTPPNKQPLHIATSANMQYAMDSLSKVFTLESGIPCQLTFGSSGKLTAQIKAGAPYDLFVAADMKYPIALYQDSLCLQAPQSYAQGSLILWSMDSEVPLDLDSLNTSRIRHIAIANPKTAPYGAAAQSLLESHGIAKKITGKLVFGESIAQTNQFIVSGAADIGITATSAVNAPHLNKKGYWVAIPPNKHPPIDQGVVVIKKKEGNNELAQAFYHFIFSERAQGILKDFGYLIHEQD